MESGLKKQFGLITAICMVVGTVIGSGVFFKAQTILQKTSGDMPMGILAWVIGGLVMIFCILAFSVLAQKHEKVNGLVDYAEATVGSKYSYMIGWFSTIIYIPCITSVLTWLTAKYFLTFICSVNPNFKLTVPVEQGGLDIGPEVFCLSAFILIAMYMINVFSPKIAGKLQVSATVIKLIPLILMAVVGTIYGLTHKIANEPTSILMSNFATSKGDFANLFGAVVATAFAYDGWIIATSINSELKNSKKHLPIALVAGAIIIITVYVLYYIGVAGGAPVDVLINNGATVAFTNVFGNVLGNILNLFIAISCLGTLNGLVLACTRGVYSLAVRGYGPKPKMFKEIDPHTNMPSNSAIIGLFVVGFWLLYFYGANLTPNGWFGYFNFDSSELPIVTLYSLYIPIFVCMIIKGKDLHPVKRYVLPVLGLIGASFMTFAAIYSHGYIPYITAKENGSFSCPILFYLITFAIIMLIGFLLMKPKGKKIA